MNEQYLDILKRYWGYDDFRGIQRDIIESIGAGHDTLGLMPTGGGKSITFQVPAMASEGTCLVITPLVALMKDQVIHLRQRGIKAAAIHSGLSHAQILTTLENTIFGGVKILYVSPERLSSPLFQTKIAHARISFITVDEAHCISQWGYDFRPSYLEIAKIRKIIPHAPILALTATATPDVVDDIQERLNFRAKCVFRMSFERKNIAYVVRKSEDKTYELLRLLEQAQGSAIVYVRSREKTKRYSDIINGCGITSTFFHAGLENAEKDKRQQDWLADRTRVIVATNAFGMGIDKPDVRVVVHMDCPDSLEAYFQEAGRAGRDGLPAKAILLYDDNDLSKLRRRTGDTYPEKDYIRKVYDHLAYYYQIAVGAGHGCRFEYNPDRFCRNFGHFPPIAHAAFKILEQAGYIEFIEEEESASRVMFTLGRDELYKLKNNSPDEDKVIVALLRLYSGLFCEYSFIDESFIAQHSDLDSHQVYLVLKALAHKNYISFIPRKSTAYIRYTQRREESQHLMFPPEIYDLLKQRFANRISEMYRYADSHETCRSKLLLAYFGEKAPNDCHQCDVCQPEKDKISTHDLKNAEQTILSLLSDGKVHTYAEIRTLKLDLILLQIVLRRLLDKEIIHQEGLGIQKA